MEHLLTNVIRFMRVMQRMGRLRVAEMPKLRHDLSISQMKILKHITLTPGLHLQKIADAVGVTAPSMSVALRKLEDNQWIYRVEDTNDKRASCFHPSKNSEELFVEVKNMQKQNLDNFLSALLPKEQDQLINLLEKAIGNLEEKGFQKGERK
jgi:DNA-binding MarR family transcriptional regulator